MTNRLALAPWRWRDLWILPMLAAGTAFIFLLVANPVSPTPVAGPALVSSLPPLGSTTTSTVALPPPVVIDCDAVFITDPTSGEVVGAICTTGIPPIPTEASTDIPGTCPPAALAVAAAGGSREEQKIAERVAWRESRCHLDTVRDTPSTGDYSWGPFQINYFGPLLPGRTALVGEPETNIESWERAGANFLLFGRTNGWCHWDGPNYCKTPTPTP